MKPSVILYKALPDDLLQRLQEHFTVHQVANLSPQTVEQNAAIFAEAEGLLGSNENVDAALLEKMPKLRATSTISVGYDNFDVDALTARKILLMHTPTVLTETVADTLMALVKRRTKNAKAFHDKCENFSFRASNETAVLITAFYSLHGDHLGYG